MHTTLVHIEPECTYPLNPVSTVIRFFTSRVWWALIEEIAPLAKEMAAEKDMACCVRGYHVYKDIERTMAKRDPWLGWSNSFVQNRCLVPSNLYHKKSRS